MATIDRAVWAAHLRADLKVEGGGLTDLSRWADQLRSEARGYWHEMTGRLADRLDVTDEDWGEMLRLHRPGPTQSLGESSVDLVPFVLAGAGLRERHGPAGFSWAPADRAECLDFLDRGRESGCHRAPAEGSP